MWSVSKIPVGLYDQLRWPLAGLVRRFAVSHLYAKFTGPCKQAALQSMRCLERYGHDKLMCHNEFYIYRQCKKEFTRQLRESRRA